MTVYIPVYMVHHSSKTQTDLYGDDNLSSEVYVVMTVGQAISIPVGYMAVYGCIWLCIMDMKESTAGYRPWGLYGDDSLSSEIYMVMIIGQAISIPVGL